MHWQHVVHLIAQPLARSAADVTLPPASEMTEVRLIGRIGWSLAPSNTTEVWWLTTVTGLIFYLPGQPSWDVVTGGTLAVMPDSLVSMACGLLKNDSLLTSGTVNATSTCLYMGKAHEELPSLGVRCVWPPGLSLAGVLRLRVHDPGLRHVTSLHLESPLIIYLRRAHVCHPCHAAAGRLFLHWSRCL